MTLDQGLSGIRANLRNVAPAEIADVLVEHQRDLVGSADPAKFAGVGTTAAGFTLPDADGTAVSLGDLTADGPAVLVFYRGQWCPYCNLTLRAYQAEVVPELGKYGARLAAISPQLPDGSAAVKESNELGFPVLSDVGNVVARAFGLTFTVGENVRPTMAKIGADLDKHNGGWELAHPSVVVVDRDRVIRFVDVHPDYTTRTEPAQLLEAVKSL
ncbi:AhpC/TSA family protein [Amycolatopsis balhimycina DSM 5908]|uniref:thioredoxin-dependent peroxiredoxin n=1 Tax=Amycolatopsis balhimycina DSM 5908 TaxID=1081091 RepID=A0A428W983_AMYBA|nr:peroxiredoxin-like family protein [Amycolatopsis balhimycina]RSM39671.1 AhpC/TSA family protein [Amycolatopsis balhimycina DSM 5908]